MNNLKLLVLLCCGSMILNSASANIFEKSTGSWSFADELGDAVVRWSRVEELVKGSDGVSILAVQGVYNGPATESFENLGQLGDRLINPDSLELDVWEYEWRISDDQVRFLYMADLGHGDHVVLVSKDQAECVLLLNPLVKNKGTSPILGINLGNDYYFTIDVSSSEDIDVTRVKRCVAEYLESQKGEDRDFIIMINYKPTMSGLKSLLFGECPIIRKSVEIYHVSAQNRGGIVEQAKQLAEQVEQTNEQSEQAKQSEHSLEVEQAKQIEHSEEAKQSEQAKLDLGSLSSLSKLSIYNKLSNPSINVQS